MLFDITNVSDLIEFLRGTSIHDSIIENYNYTGDNNRFDLRVFNPIFKEKMNFVFNGVECLKFLRGHEIGCSKTINSLTVEDSCSELCYGAENMIYLLFQMFSGDELHIVFESLYVEQSV